MTGQEVFRTALLLLGYTELLGDGVYRRALPLVNQITAELWYDIHSDPFKPLNALTADIPLSARQVQTVLPYGVAMLLAAAEGDVNNQALYAGLYDGRRVASVGERVHDALPVTAE